MQKYTIQKWFPNPSPTPKQMERLGKAAGFGMSGLPLVIAGIALAIGKVTVSGGLFMAAVGFAMFIGSLLYTWLYALKIDRETKESEK